MMAWRRHGKAPRRTSDFVSMILVMMTVVMIGAREDAWTGGLAFTRDTLYESRYFSHVSTDETWLVNRGSESVRIDSLSVTLDRALYPTLYLGFNISMMENGMRRYERIFYWHDGERPWLSRPMVVAPRDSIRIYNASIDLCRKCVGKRAPSTTSYEIRAPVRFRSNSGHEATLLIRGWYFMPSGSDEEGEGDRG